jgi:hypothetical protein
MAYRWKMRKLKGGALFSPVVVNCQGIRGYSCSRSGGGNSERITTILRSQIHLCCTKTIVGH